MAVLAAIIVPPLVSFGAEIGGGTPPCASSLSETEHVSTVDRRTNWSSTTRSLIPYPKRL